MEWIYIPNTNNGYILYENGEVFSLYNYNWRLGKYLRRKIPKILSINNSNCIQIIDDQGEKKKLSINKLLLEHFDIDIYNRSPLKYPYLGSSRKERQREYRRYESKSLTNGYIVHCLRLPIIEVNIELIETKRKQICLRRKLKQIISQE